MKGPHAVLGLVALVQFRDASHGSLEDLQVVGTRGLGARSQVAEERERDIRVAVREIRDLKMLDDLACRGNRRQERWYDGQGAVRLVDRPPEVELGQPLRWEHE